MKNWIAISVLLLSGCGNLQGPFYVQPESGARARIRFVADSSTPTQVWIYDNIECKDSPGHKVAILGQWVVVGSDERHRLGMPLGDKYGDKIMTEDYIPANKIFPFVMGASTGATIAPGVDRISSCAVSLSFEPKENYDYEAVLLLGGKTCQVQFNRIDSTGGNPGPVKDDTVRRLDNCRLKLQ